MIWLARVYQAHPVALPATLRERFGVSWWAAGQPEFPWVEALALVRAAAGDTSTRLGAEMDGWAYPAGVLDVAGAVLAAQTQDAAAAIEQLLPFSPSERRAAAEARALAEAQAAVEASIQIV